MLKFSHQLAPELAPALIDEQQATPRPKQQSAVRGVA